MSILAQNIFEFFKSCLMFFLCFSFCFVLSTKQRMLSKFFCWDYHFSASIHIYHLSKFFFFKNNHLHHLHPLRKIFFLQKHPLAPLAPTCVPMQSYPLISHKTQTCCLRMINIICKNICRIWTLMTHILSIKKSR